MPMQPPPQLKSSMFGRMPVGGKSANKDPGGKPAAAGPKGFRNETRIGIQAPAEVVWELVVNVNDWGRWSVLYPEASGDIRIGGELQLVAQLPGQKPIPLKSTVQEWVPNEQLHFNFKIMGGMVRIVRYIEIEELAPESCVVSNGEITSGLLGPMVVKSAGAAAFRGMKQMNEALKAEAEALWQSRKAKA